MPNFAENLDMSSKTPLTLKPLLKYWYMSWVIDNNWLIHDSPGSKLDWFEEIYSFLIKYSCNLLL